MTYYRSVGEVPRKRHTRTPYAEELMGAEGFSGASSLLYHRHSPSAVVRIESADGIDDDGERRAATDGLRPNRPLRPRHLRLADLSAGDRTPIAGNSSVTIAWESRSADGPLRRNAIGDELVYVHQGRATLQSVFGLLAVGPGDYVVVPASTTHRWTVDEGPLRLFVLEAAGHVAVPDRYLTARGQFKEGAPFSERDLRAPEGPLVEDGSEVDVVVKTRDGLHIHTMAHHPFDVVGWDGCLYPWALQIRDFEPIVGRLHQPPPVHQTFAGPRFVVCSFVPRLYDFDPDAVKVPYHHANVDSDEVLFYADGNFMSRKGAGISVGSMTIHPAGFVHGPQPGSREASESQVRTDELAVMVDTFDPLLLGTTALGCEDETYWRSWAGKTREN